MRVKTLLCDLDADKTRTASTLNGLRLTSQPEWQKKFKNRENSKPRKSKLNFM